MASSGRVVCARCGSNNFDTVTACWKCGSPLGGAAPSAPQTYSNPVAYPSDQQRGSFVDGMTSRAVGFGIVAGDAARANRAAFWLGMLFPYFGFPIGLAFMMCDDKRRQEVGRLCILWSILSGVVHLLFTVVSIIGMRPYFNAVLGAVKSGGLGKGLGGGGGAGMDGM